MGGGAGMRRGEGNWRNGSEHELSTREQTIAPHNYSHRACSIKWHVLGGGVSPAISGHNTSHSS